MVTVDISLPVLRRYLSIDDNTKSKTIHVDSCFIPSSPTIQASCLFTIELITSTMHLMYYLNDKGERVYTLKVSTKVLFDPSHGLRACRRKTRRRSGQRVLIQPDFLRTISSANIEWLSRNDLGSTCPTFPRNPCETNFLLNLWSTTAKSIPSSYPSPSTTYRWRILVTIILRVFLFV